MFDKKFQNEVAKILTELDSQIMSNIKQYLEFHSTALSLRAKRNDILASNIANAATPNFKARDIDFSAEMNRANNLGQLDTTDPSHIKTFSSKRYRFFKLKNR